MFKSCKICNKIFYRKPSHSLKYWNKKTYCSRNCFGASLKGKKLTKEHKLKLSLVKKGKIPVNLSTIREIKKKNLI